MNITEAVRTQSLLAWATDPAPAPETTAIAVVDARYLADRARRVLGAGPTPDDIETAIRDRATIPPAQAVPTPAQPGTQAETPAGTPAEAADRLARVAALLNPCPRPAIEDGWNLCAHTQPWPCPTTRAAWIATGTHPDGALGFNLCDGGRRATAEPDG